MRKNIIWLAAFCGLLIVAVRTEANEANADTLPMRLDGGALVGPGAEAIADRLPTAQFIMIGEDHGFADSPEISLALAKASRRYGVVNHVVEEGPLMEEWAEARLRAGAAEEFGAALGDRKLAFAFLSRLEDAMLADYFVDNAPRGSDVLWGVDQEFMASPLVHFETLRSLAKTDAARMLMAELISAETAAAASGDFGGFFLASSSVGDFDQLRGAFARAPEALAIIAGLEESAAIYGAYNAGRNYSSNTDRIAMIRRQFLTQYGDARGRAPRALFKFGATHVGRGTTFVNTFDLGSLTDGIAAANGLDVLRILFLPLAGEQLAINPAVKGFHEKRNFFSEDVANLLNAIGVSKDALPEEGYAVIPLEAVRRRIEARGLKALSDEQRFYVLGFDYLVTTGRARAASLVTD